MSRRRSATTADELSGSGIPKVALGTVMSGPGSRDTSLRRGLSGLRALPAVYRRHSFTVLRVSVGLLFLWFGALKLLPNVSHAEDMATRVMHELTSGRVPADVSRPLLAMMEMLIGVGLVTGLLLRLTLLVFFAHMAGTFTTLIVLPAEMWDGNIASPTMAGQYVIKNVVLVAAGLAVAVHLTSPSRSD
ncbi:DoxX family membrane protein [Streptomyces sp. NPDC002784]